MIKVLDGVKDKDKVLNIAKSLGLDLLDSDKVYCLKKIGAKKVSSKGYPNSFEVIRGNVYVVGVDDLIWIAVLGSGTFEWFKTSPIISFTKTDDGFAIETKNSFYILVNLL